MRLQDRADDLGRRARRVADQHRVEAVLGVKIIGNIGGAQARDLDTPVAAGGGEGRIGEGREMGTEECAGAEMQDACLQLAAVIGGKLCRRRQAVQVLQSIAHSL